MPIKMLDSLYYSQEEYEKLEGMLLEAIEIINNHTPGFELVLTGNIINWWNEYKSRKEKE